MKKRMLFCALFFLGGVFPFLKADVAVKSAEKIAFLGDSITQQGNSRPAGYIHLVMHGLKAAGVEAVAVPAGISGHKSNQMLERLERDVLAHKPDWLLISCGVNDVNHGKNGVSLEDYRKNIRAIVDQALAAGSKVMILTATMITEQPEYINNQKLAPYNDFLRDLARERNTLLADLNALMQQEVSGRENKNENLLTVDGVHMNGLGNQMMAAGILQAFGVSSEQIARLRNEWNDLPNAMQAPVGNLGRVGVSVNQYRKLKLAAQKKNLGLADMLLQNWEKMLREEIDEKP